MPLKLEQEWAGVWLKPRFTIWCEHEFVEELGIKKPWVRLPSLHAVAWLLGVAGNGDLLPYLEAHLEVFGDLIEVPSQLLCRWRPIKCGVVADCTKERLSIVEILAILTEAFPGKGTFGVLLEVDLSLPAFIGPSGGAESNERGECHGKVYRLAGQFLNGLVINLYMSGS